MNGISHNDQCNRKVYWSEEQFGLLFWLLSFEHLAFLVFSYKLYSDAGGMVTVSRTMQGWETGFSDIFLLRKMVKKGKIRFPIPAWYLHSILIAILKLVLYFILFFFFFSCSFYFFHFFVTTFFKVVSSNL